MRRVAFLALVLTGCAGGALPPAVDATIDKLDTAVAHLSAGPAVYALTLELCAHDDTCLAKVRGAWMPIIEGFQILHEVYCGAKPTDPGCP